MISIQDAVDDLYRIVVEEGKATSKARLDLLAELCVEQLRCRGLNKIGKEVIVPGFGRSKQWDVAWPTEGKVRLGISLKSLLSNIGGTVPNRIDDLMGEMANIQLRSPEIVSGYIMIFEATRNGGGTRKDGKRWLDVFRDAVEHLSDRRAPAWAAGMVEASAIIAVDFTNQPCILEAPDIAGFFDHLVDRLRQRNPDLFE